ncbi:hypothetical protein NEHOM01_0317, partial [Nematocida homosporus]|uniref:uncharacterized protein n=1 Tax=Nematocida homosporus TaxID=1912981 RepID=UPI002220F4F7
NTPHLTPSTYHQDGPSSIPPKVPLPTENLTPYYPRYHYYTNKKPILTISGSSMEEYVKISNVQDWKLRQALPLRLATIFNYIVIGFSNAMIGLLYNYSDYMASGVSLVSLFFFGLFLLITALNLTAFVLGIRAFFARCMVNRMAKRPNPVWDAIWYYIRQMIKWTLAVTIVEILILVVFDISPFSFMGIATVLGFLALIMSIYRLSALNKDKREEAKTQDMSLNRASGYRIAGYMYKLEVAFAVLVVVTAIVSIGVAIGGVRALDQSQM